MVVGPEATLGEDLPLTLRELYRGFDGFRDPDSWDGFGHGERHD